METKTGIQEIQIDQQEKSFVNRIHKAKLGVGIFVEGSYLHVASLAKVNKKIQLIDAETVRLTQRMEPAPVEDELISKVSNLIYEEPEPFELNEESDTSQSFLNEFDNDQYENAEILEKIFSKFPNTKYNVSISIPEPNIYYFYFPTDWQLKSKKLKDRVVKELSRERIEAKAVTADAIRMIKLYDGRLLVIVCENDVSIQNVFDTLKHNISTQTANIRFVETAEISLINLVIENYQFDEMEVSVVIYIGHEFSRLIFLRGREILNISYIIGAGQDSENTANTIYSRLLLEKDNLNLPQPGHIILAGETFEVGLKDYLTERFSEDINIDYMHLPRLNINTPDPLISRFSVAIGAALRTLDDSNKSLYNVDLTPEHIRERQKKFKLGIRGWILLALIPIITFLATVNIGTQQRELSQLQNQLQFHKSELSHLQKIDEKVNAERNKLINYDSAMGVLDRLLIGTKTWSRFLNISANIIQDIRHIWITEIRRSAHQTVMLRGYAIYRSRIPRLSGALENATLKSVEVQDIRGHMVYHFEIELKLPQK